jgi:hypothetical protein
MVSRSSWSAAPGLPLLASHPPHSGRPPLCRERFQMLLTLSIFAQGRPPQDGEIFPRLYASLVDRQPSRIENSGQRNYSGRVEPFYNPFNQVWALWLFPQYHLI